MTHRSVWFVTPLDLGDGGITEEVSIHRDDDAGVRG